MLGLIFKFLKKLPSSTVNEQAATFLDKARNKQQEHQAHVPAQGRHTPPSWFSSLQQNQQWVQDGVSSFVSHLRKRYAKREF